MSRALALLALAGCGRLGFDEVVTGDGGDDAPLPVGRWRSVTLGEWSTCAITLTDELWCWGYDFDGQLGIGEQTAIAPPTQVTGSWRTVAMLGVHSCGIQTDDSLWCWGRNLNGALGVGPENAVASSPVQVGTATWGAIAVGRKFTCGIQSDSSLWCWGSNADGLLGDGGSTDLPQPTKIGTAAWTAIAIGHDHTCAIQADQSMWCWGQNYTGQLGDGSLSSRNVPVVVDAGRSWAAVSANFANTCGIDVAGDVWCWGANYYGMLGSGTFDGSDVPIRASTARGSAITTGYLHSCVLDAGVASCWGSTAWGEHGYASETNLDRPRTLDGVTRMIAAGQRITCLIDDAAHLLCSGANSFGQTGQPFGEVHVPVASDSRTDWVTLAAQRRHGCGRVTDGSTWCWGTGESGQIGDATYRDRQVPTAIIGDFLQLAVGNETTAGITSDLRAFLWGLAADNTYPGVPTERYTATTSIALGSAHGCRISGTALLCGGRNSSGQLGDGTTVDKPGVTIAGAWKRAFAGHETTCAVASNDTVRCWGQGMAGQVGNGMLGDFSSPQAVTLGPPTTIGIGLGFACALLLDSSLWCWGDGSRGQLGNGVPSQSTTPMQVGTKTNWDKLAVGDWHVCAIERETNGRSLWCWGHGDQGQLGDPTLPQQRNLPYEVGGLDWTEVAAGDHFTCALKTNGSRWCFGANEDAQLGNGRAWRPSFVAVP